MNLRTHFVSALTVVVLLSCKDPEITSPYSTPVDSFDLQGVVRTDTVIVPYLPQRSSNIVYMAEGQFVLQVAIFNMPSQTFAGSFEIQVPPNIVITNIVENVKYFDSTANGICVKHTADSTAQYGVSYTKGIVPNTPPKGVLFNLVCKPLYKGDGVIRFPVAPLVQRTIGTGAVGMKTPTRIVNVLRDSLRISVRDGLGG
jgi:hypothetical protein